MVLENLLLYLRSIWIFVMYFVSCYGEELSILDLLHKINIVCQLLHKYCLLFSWFLCCDDNEKCVESVMIYDVGIYSNSIAFLLWFTDVAAISSNFVMVLINDGLSCFIPLCWYYCDKWMMQLFRSIVMKINYGHWLNFVIWYLCCYTSRMPYLPFLLPKTWF